MASCRSLIRVLSLCAFFIGGLEGASIGAEISPALSDALSKLRPGEKVPVIVRFNRLPPVALPDQSSRAKREKIVRTLRTRTQDSVRTVSPLLAKRGATHKDLWIINGISTNADAAMVAELSRAPRVASVTLDAALPGPGVNYGSTAAPEWNLSMVQAPELWSMGITGANAVVAAMDTGVDFNHPDLKGSWRGGTNSWYDPYGEHAEPYDRDGHGTMVTGIINGGGNGGTAIGIAPGATWVGVKIFNDSGYASLSAIHQGFQWLLDPDGDPATNDAPNVVNSSWGLGNINGCSTEFTGDIQVLNDAGIATVFASGNFGPNQFTSTSPANDIVSVSAGAIDSGGNIAGFSSRGPSACDGSVYPLLTAPGVDIKTANLTYGGVIPQSYSIVSGTSFAAAHVSGALALLASAFPSAGPNELVSALLASTNDLGPVGADNSYGAGLIQLKRAYDILAQGASGQQPQPVIDQDSDGYPMDVDCNDNDPSVHPDAPEVKSDGIDQDCNGYDLTISITRATYSDAYRTLRIEAKSSLGAAAAFGADGFGPMSWSASLKKWVLTVRNVAKPAAITVSGIEGSDTLVLQASAPAPSPDPVLQPVPQPIPQPVPQPAPDPRPQPVDDRDADGYLAGQDCNDNDPAIHPGAVEIQSDGIDQDCNGYDLTIAITRATYSNIYKSLRIEAKSSLGAGAALNVEGFGPMSWSASLKKWVLTARTSQRPADVVVSGVEGSTTAPVN